MKFLSFLLFLLLTVNSLFALEVPYLSGMVVDEVGILSENFRISIEEKLKEHQKTTSNQVVVLIIPSLEGEVLEEFSLKVATTWKLGQKGKDNGVLLLIAKADRKLRIEVGYGLEGALTDVLCKQIIRNEITPEFKKGNFEKGVNLGVDAILSAIKGEYVGSNPSDSSEFVEEYTRVTNNIGDATLPIFFRIIFGSIFFVVITPFTIMAVFIPYFGWFLYFFLMPFYATFPVVALGPIGGLLLPIYVVGMFFVKIYVGNTKSGKELADRLRTKFESTNSRRRKNGRYSSSSGWSSGSSSGTSSGSSGGFSGGGGSFGGGGSSGSW